MYSVTNSSSESSPEMTEISIEEQGSSGGSSGNEYKEGNSRPATLPVSSPFGPPGVFLSSSHSSVNNGVDESGGIVSSNSCVTLAAPKTTPIDVIKEWSVTTFKCTKQMVNEKLGKCQRTVDTALESEIEKLRETQKKYALILKAAKEMSSIHSSLVTQQIQLHETFNDLALRDKTKPVQSTTPASNTPGNDSGNLTSSLSTDFRQNAEMLRSVAKNGEKLVAALRFFCSNLSTLVNKTIEDTIVTIRSFEQARLEYDAERNTVADLLPAQAAAANPEKLIAARAKYDRLRQDVSVKLKFLEENKAKVMHKQLILFHNAFTAYASGNSAALDGTLTQFSIKATSFLEK
ncbi:ADP ribosylation factor interacting protein arfaptin isoform X2 [Brevipalpus obovatus]|uniref:ADP ribosylation factor interacting protein arfaptin isoform X2 n=1 Tax=Brevipalpus obovatus TaxID=246614 RepID=UPI003D9EF26D